MSAIAWVRGLWAFLADWSLHGPLVLPEFPEAWVWLEAETVTVWRVAHVKGNSTHQTLKDFDTEDQAEKHAASRKGGHVLVYPVRVWVDGIAAEAGAA